MADYKKYINALRKCAKEHDNDTTYTGHIRVSDLCRDTADLLEELKQEPCEDAISREEVIQSRPEWLSEDVERDTDEQTVVDRAFNRGWNSCLKEFLKNIKELPSVTPKPKTGHWVFTKTMFDKHGCTAECSYCHKKWKTYDEIRFKKEHNYCPNCGCRMVEPQESEEEE